MLRHQFDEDRAGRPLSFITDSIRTRAVALGKQGLHASAAADYQVLVDLDPHDAKAGMRLAHHHMSAGHRTAAADEYVRVAAVYARQGGSRRAIALVTRALELEPQRVVRSRLEPLVMHLGAKAALLCEQIALVHLVSKRPEAAREVLALLVEADPAELLRRLRLAELDLSLGRRDEALVGLSIAAEGLRAHGRTAELARTLEAILAYGGPNEAILRELASIYARCGQPRRVLNKLEALHRVVPNDRLVLQRLARVHAQLGRLQSTLRLLEALAALMTEPADRSELHDALRGAATWSSELSYQRSVEALLERSSSQTERARPPKPRSSAVPRRTQPPPPPRWSQPRASTAAGVIHVLDLDADAELIVDHASQ